MLGANGGLASRTGAGHCGRWPSLLTPPIKLSPRVARGDRDRSGADRTASWIQILWSGRIAGAAASSVIRRQRRPSPRLAYLRDAIFTRTDRIAWRHIGGHVDLIEVSLLGSLADPVGATPGSFGAHTASWPGWLAAERRLPDRKGVAAPHYWHCMLNTPLHKTLSQPWFRPFSRPPHRHRVRFSPTVGLQQLLSHETHDRPDIWCPERRKQPRRGRRRPVARRVGRLRLDAFHQPGGHCHGECRDLQMAPDLQRQRASCRRPRKR